MEEEEEQEGEEDGGCKKSRRRDYSDGERLESEFPVRPRDAELR